MGTPDHFCLSCDVSCIFFNLSQVTLKKQQSRKPLLSPAVTAEDLPRFTFQPPAWWSDAVFAKTRKKGIQIQLITTLKTQYAMEVDPSEMSRCLRGGNVQYGLAHYLSLLLEVQQPLFVPITPEESERMGQQRELTLARARAEPRLTREVDPLIKALRESVEAEANGNVTRDQIPRVRSPHDSRLSELGGRVARTRPRAKRGKPRAF